MKKTLILTACFALFTSCLLAQTKAKTPASTPQEDTIQYTLGVYMMQQLLAKTGFVVTNPTLFKKAIDDVSAGKKLMIDPTGAEKRLLAYQELYRREKGKKLEELLFAQLRTQPNYAKLPSGVMYTMVKTGQGPTPTLKDTVIVNVNSMLPDGTVIDDVNKSKQSYMALTSDMIPGLRDVLQRMPEGSVCRAVLPASQAYGSIGTPTVPPNSAIIYDIALVTVKKVK
jgi:FKBP-type peptidyl-prolyl cis-trans isomerase